MGRVKTREITLAYAVESSLGVLPGTPLWKSLEPNGLSVFGAEITQTPRRPITGNRNLQKGAVTDLDSSVEWEGDLTMEHVLDFLEGFFFAQFTGPTNARLASGSNFNNLAADDDPPPAGTDPGFTHDALSAAYAAGTLIYTRGFANVANNGLFHVDAASTTTATVVTGTPSIVDETPTEAANATLEVAGVRAATGDLVLTVSAPTATLTSTTLDFTTLGLTVGQTIHIGGLTTAQQFSAGAGYARITALSANSMSLDKLGPNLATDPGTGDTVDLLFGQFLRNVASTDSDYLERSFQFEVNYVNLDNPGPGDAYEYAEGNFCNTIAFQLPLADKATIAFAFVGTDTPVPTTTRATGAASPRQVVRKTAFGTSSDIGRLRLQDSSATALTSCFKALTLTINNGVTPDKCLGNLGAMFMNLADFEVTLELTVHFDDPDLASEVRNNGTVTADFALDNGDGAIHFDLPSLQLSGFPKEFPDNETVTVGGTATAFEDAVLGYSIGASLFPTVPATAS